jgi:hypothetical protein
LGTVFLDSTVLRASRVICLRVRSVCLPLFLLAAFFRTDHCWSVTDALGQPGGVGPEREEKVVYLGNPG